MYCLYVQGTTVRRDHDSFSIAANYQPGVTCPRRSRMTFSVAVYLSYLDKTVPQVSHMMTFCHRKGRSSLILHPYFNCYQETEPQPQCAII